MMVKEDEKALKTGKENMNVEPEEKKTKVTGEEVESQKPIVNRNIDLQLDLEKADRDSATVTVSRNKLLQHVQKQQQPNIEKIGKKNCGFLFFFFFFFPFELRTFVLLKFCQFGR
jgi:hypothetical protein